MDNSHCIWKTSGVSSSRRTCWNKRRLLGISTRIISWLIGHVDTHSLWRSSQSVQAELRCFPLPHNHYLPRIWWASWSISAGAAGCACRCEMAPYKPGASVTRGAINGPNGCVNTAGRARSRAPCSADGRRHCEPDRSLWCRGTNEHRRNTLPFISCSISCTQPEPLVAG